MRISPRRLVPDRVAGASPPPVRSWTTTSDVTWPGFRTRTRWRWPPTSAACDLPGALRQGRPAVPVATKAMISSLPRKRPCSWRAAGRARYHAPRWLECTGGTNRIAKIPAPRGRAPACPRPSAQQPIPLRVASPAAAWNANPTRASYSALVCPPCLEPVQTCVLFDYSLERQQAAPMQNRSR